MKRDISQKIKNKEKDLQKVLSDVFELKNMVWGSFCLIHVKCGKKYCRCQNGILHPHNRMSWQENGQGFSRAVPKEEYEWIEEMTENYRRFKKLRRELVKLQKEINLLLDEYESSIVKQTRKGKLYLEVG